MHTASGSSPEKRATPRRVLPESAFEPGGFKGWSTPKTFNDAAAGVSPAAGAGSCSKTEMVQYAIHTSNSLGVIRQILRNNMLSCMVSSTGAKYMFTKLTFDGVGQHLQLRLG
jgi:hypothetical protein